MTQIIVCPPTVLDLRGVKKILNRPRIRNTFGLACLNYFLNFILVTKSCPSITCTWPGGRPSFFSHRSSFKGVGVVQGEGQICKFNF